MDHDIMSLRGRNITGTYYLVELDTGSVCITVGAKVTMTARSSYRVQPHKHKQKPFYLGSESVFRGFRQGTISSRLLIFKNIHDFLR